MTQRWFATWNTRSKKSFAKHVSDYSFIFLQEVSREDLIAAAKDLQKRDDRGYTYTWIHGNGNGVITNMHVVSHTFQSLDVGYGTEGATYFDIMVDVLRTNSGIHSNILRVCCVDLDKNDEETRWEQAAAIRHISEFDIIMGSFNTLYAHDHSYLEKECINHERINRDLSPMSFEVVFSIIAKGFIPTKFVGETSNLKGRTDFIFLKKQRNIRSIFNEVRNPCRRNERVKHYVSSSLIRLEP